MIGQNSEDSGIKVETFQDDGKQKTLGESEKAKHEENLESDSKSSLEATEPSDDDVKKPNEEVENSALIMEDTKIKANLTESENPAVSELDMVNSTSKSNGKFIESSDTPLIPNEEGNVNTDAMDDNPVFESMNKETRNPDLKIGNSMNNLEDNENEEKLVHGKLINDASEVPSKDQVEPEYVNSEQSMDYSDEYPEVNKVLHYHLIQKFHYHYISGQET